MTFKEKIINIMPFKKENYINISLTKLGGCAAYYLHKNGIPLTFNYIGIAMFKMFPDIFSCGDEFPEYPSLDKINREMMHMTIANQKNKTINIKKPSILVGSAKLGYQITEYGIAVAEQTLQLIKTGNKNIVHKPNHDSLELHKQSTMKEYLKIKNSNQFKNFLVSNHVESFAPWKVFNIKPFTQNSTVYQNIKLALTKAKEKKDSDVIKFIQILLTQLN